MINCSLNLLFKPLLVNVQVKRNLASRLSHVFADVFLQSGINALHQTVDIKANSIKDVVIRYSLRFKCSSEFLESICKSFNLIANRSGRCTKVFKYILMFIYNLSPIFIGTFCSFFKISTKALTEKRFYLCGRQVACTNHNLFEFVILFEVCVLYALQLCKAHPASLDNNVKNIAYGFVGSATVLICQCADKFLDLNGHLSNTFAVNIVFLPEGF